MIYLGDWVLESRGTKWVNKYISILMKGTLSYNLHGFSTGFPTCLGTGPKINFNLVHVAPYFFVFNLDGSKTMIVMLVIPQMLEVKFLLQGSR